MECGPASTPARTTQAALFHPPPPPPPHCLSTHTHTDAWPFKLGFLTISFGGSPHRDPPPSRYILPFRLRYQGFHRSRISRVTSPIMPNRRQPKPKPTPDISVLALCLVGLLRGRLCRGPGHLRRWQLFQRRAVSAPAIHRRLSPPSPLLSPLPPRLRNVG